MLFIFLQGFLLQASLILALGAQNIFVLNSGLRRQKHIWVASASSLCDTFLILVGVLGVATVFVQVPALKIGLGALGVAFLLFYGILKLNEARVGVKLTESSERAVTTRQAIFASLGFSLLNPHVYLDTVVLIGGYSSRFGEISERLYFGLGASMFSTLWFFGLALSASMGSRLLKNAKALQVISLISGIILVLLAVKLGLEVVGWMSET